MLRSSCFMDYKKIDEELVKLEKMGNDIIKRVTSEDFDPKEIMNEIHVYVKRTENVLDKLKEEENDNSN